MRVRTNIAALIAGAVLSAVLSLVIVGNGAPPQTPARPMVEIIPLEADPNLPTWSDAQAGRKHPSPPPSAKPARAATQPGGTLDSYVVQGLRGGLVYIAVFLILHFALRRFAQTGRWLYAGIGSLSALVAVAGQTPAWGWRIVMGQGNLSLYLAIIAMAGAIIGFLYRWRAGLEAEGDDPALLQAALNAAQASPTDGDAAPGSPTASADHALIDTGQAEYFDGPLQVRTTVPVMFVAAIVSAGAFGLVRVILGMAGELAVRLPTGANSITEAVSQSIQSQMLTILALGAIAPLPFTVLTLFGHLILKAKDKQSYLAYLFMGLGAPVLASLIMGPMGLYFGVQAAVPMAIAMCVYRNMAGVEPKPVKEDIMVKDRRDLVGADHARRQFGRLVKS